MAKVTKKQEQKFSELTRLFHELIIAKHTNKKEVFESVLKNIYEVTKPEEE